MKNQLNQNWKKEYIEWKKDVFNTLNEIKSEIDENSEAKKLYNGFSVWYSKLIPNPKIMLIGINPNFNSENSEKEIDLEEDDVLYDLRNGMDEIFEEVGIIKNIYKQKTIRTNFFYIKTNNGNNGIYNCFHMLGDEDKVFKTFYNKSYDWNKKLINILNPKIIICEGQSVYSRLFELFGSGMKNWENSCGYFKYEKNNRIIVGYSRFFNRIRNKEALTELLKIIISKHKDYIFS